MKKFILLIRGEDKWEQLSPAEAQAAVEKYSAWAKKLREEGRLVDAEGLAPEARHLVPHEGQIVVSDGPFTETKEIVGGYYVFTAKDLDEATEICRACPSLEYGGNVEIRPVMDYS